MKKILSLNDIEVIEERKASFNSNIVKYYN